MYLFLQYEVYTYTYVWNSFEIYEIHIKITLEFKTITKAKTNSKLIKIKRIKSTIICPKERKVWSTLGPHAWMNSSICYFSYCINLHLIGGQMEIGLRSPVFRTSCLSHLRWIFATHSNSENAIGSKPFLYQYFWQ